MKSQIRVSVALLTGIAVGAAAVQALHAQVKPPGYLIADVTVTEIKATRNMFRSSQAL